MEVAHLEALKQYRDDLEKEKDQSSHNRLMQQWFTNQMIKSQPGSSEQNANAGAAQYYSTQP